MAHNTAVHSSKNRFQRAVFADNFQFVIVFFCNVYGYSYGSHNAAVQIVQRGFVGFKQAFAFARFYFFFGNICFLVFHDFTLGFDTDRVVMFDVPNVSMAAPFYLGF